MADTFASFAGKVDRLGKEISGPGMSRSVGKAVEDAAERAAARDLGPDRAFSGMKRRIPLRATAEISRGRGRIDLGPKGLWDLAQRGRQRVGRAVVPVSGQALKTPWGPRSSARGSRSRGLGTVDDAVEAMGREAPKVVDRQVSDAIRKIF